MALNVPGLDFEKGLEVFEDEIDDYISALQSFIKNTPDIIEKLRGVTQENLPDYAITIHGLKSISAWICAEKIREGALELETLAKAGDYSAVTAKNNAFLLNVDSFLQKLKVEIEPKVREKNERS